MNLLNRTAFLAATLAATCLLSGCAVGGTALMGILAVTTAAKTSIYVADLFGVLPEWTTIRPVGTPESALALSIATADRLGYVIEQSEFTETGFIIVWKSGDGSLTSGVEVEPYGETRISFEIRSSNRHEFDVFINEIRANLDKLEDPTFHEWGEVNWNDPKATPLVL